MQPLKTLKHLEYNAVKQHSSARSSDPYRRPAFSKADRLRRALWNLCWLLLYRPSPRPFHAWRAFLLRLFGASLGPHCHFYPGSRIWAPWKLTCEDHVAAADNVEIYNVAAMRISSHAILSQGAYICSATHDYNDPDFPLLAYRMTIGAHAWICARACVAPGVNVGEGAVLGLASVATHDLEPWGVYAGSPALRVKERKRILHSTYATD